MNITVNIDTAKFSENDTIIVNIYNSNGEPEKVPQESSEELEDVIIKGVDPDLLENY